MEIFFSDLYTENPLNVFDDWDTLIGIVAKEFNITSDGVILFEEEYFPVVEFAASLVYWKNKHFPKLFLFTSLEYNEEWLFRFQYLEDQQIWEISFDGSEKTVITETVELENTVNLYIDEVLKLSSKFLGKDIDLLNLYSKTHKLL